MRRLLVLASTYPRWAKDTNPPFVHELSKRLTAEFDVTVLTSGFSGAKRFELMDGVKVCRYRYFLRKHEVFAGAGILPTLRKQSLYWFVLPFFVLGQLAGCMRLFWKHRFDVIHAHWILPQGLVAMVCKMLYGTPYVITSHGGDIFGARQFDFLKRMVIRRADKVAAVSTAIRDEIHKLVPGKDVSVLPMGVDSEKFNPRRRSWRLKKQLGIAGPMLLFVGRLAEKKGLRYLIDAMPGVLEKHPTAKLVVVGGGPLEQAHKRHVTALGIQKSVIFTGPIPNDDLPKYYATADVFVSPSETEGFGLTFVEAIMSGCVPIGTRVGGIGDIIKDNVNGLSIDMRDDKSITRQILFLLNDADSQQHMSMNAKSSSLFFSWDVSVSRYRELIKNLRRETHNIDLNDTSSVSGGLS